jgi:hypothetical protein
MTDVRLGLSAELHPVFNGAGIAARDLERARSFMAELHESQQRGMTPSDSQRQEGEALASKIDQGVTRAVHNAMIIASSSHDEDQLQVQIERVENLSTSLRTLLSPAR